MCGISGIINFSNQAVSEYEIKFITNLIAHRGPDGEGFYYGENFALGHRRLAILDLSEDGKQPMIFADSGNVIVYNGEIYNYLEIKDELTKKGFTFNTKTDTEVILAAYEHWGKDCVQKFNGMWSFSIFDKKRNILFCSRDRFGVKPFYYTVMNQKFIFGSEIKQLLHFFEKVYCNQNILLEYLITGVEEFSNETFFKNIFKLEQGCNMVYDLNNHTYKTEKYYQINTDFSYKNVNEQEAVSLYKERLMSAVRLRMRSDVEVGTCLSGGLDSSSIVALASNILKENTERKMKVIHAKANDNTIDESNYAKIVSKHTNTDFIEITPSYEEFTREIHQIIKTQEEPFGSPSIVMQYFVFKKAKQSNCIVMLDGQGGDETLLGYERYYPAYLKSLNGISKFLAFLNSSKNSKLSTFDVLKYYYYFTNYSIRLRILKKKHAYLKTEILNSFTSDVLKNISNNYLNVLELQKMEITKTQLPHLLKYEDKNSMIHSVESRLPFLDYQCLECALSLPDKYKIKNGWTKYILRKSVADILPDSVVWRKNKLGFNAPEKEWLTKMNHEMIENIQKSMVLKKIINFNQFSYEKLDLRTKWRLFNIAKWEEIYDVEY